MAPPLEPVYLIAGSDRSKVRRAIHRLRARIETEGGQVDVLDPERTGPDDAVASCNALGLFGGPRLVVIDGVEPSGADAPWASGGVAPVERYGRAPAPETVLALVGGPGLRRDHRLFKVLPTQALLVFDVPEPAQLPDHIAREAARIGVALTPTGLRRLVAVLTRRPAAIEAELEKLAAYGAGETLDEDAIELLVEAAVEDVPWAFLDAVSGRDRERAFALLDRLRAGGATTPGLVSLLGAQAQSLLTARRALDDGRSRQDAAQRVGGHPFRAGKVVDAARRWSGEQAAGAVIAFADLDHAVKGGSRADPDLALDRVLAAVLT